jgi:hypothetical protein
VPSPWSWRAFQRRLRPSLSGVKFILSISKTSVNFNENTRCSIPSVTFNNSGNHRQQKATFMEQNHFENLIVAQLITMCPACNETWRSVFTVASELLLVL